MNLADIQAMLYNRLGFSPSTVDPLVVTRLLSYIHETQHTILGSKGFSRLRRTILPFDSISGSPYCTLPQAATNVSYVRDPTNRRLMGPMSLEDLRYEDPGLAFSSSVPYGWSIINLADTVAAQPSIASELFVKSSSATDGATKTAFVEGIITGGYYRTASVALNGVTAVSLGAAITTWIEVRKFYIALTAGGATTAAGLVTLTQTSGAGAQLSQIGIGKAYPRYTRIQLYPTPAAVVTYAADVELHIENMTQASDEPYLPEDFHDLLVIGPLMKEYGRREKPVQYAEEAANWRQRKSELRAWVGRINGESRRQDMRPSFSQLGPYFRAGT